MRVLMTKVLILGVDGMLGHGVKKAFQNTSLEMFYTSRRNHPHNTNLLKYEAGADNDRDLSNKLSEIDYVINCIGVIKPEIINKDSESILNSIKINSSFPHLLNKLAIDNGVKVIQIATDCVYDGRKGNYNESDIHNAEDIYGKTKSLGEVESNNFMNLRVSIIGPEVGSKKSLFEWVKNQSKGATINGFTDHMWNGITTFNFGELVKGIISTQNFKSGTFHIVPDGFVTKYDLVSKISRIIGREDLNVQKVNSGKTINRTLATENPSENEKIWEKSVYGKILSMDEVVETLVH
jgi:dTDP-4-dehydrorhamnose reductase